MTDADTRIRAIPIWQGDPQWRPLKGGLSNESFFVTDKTGQYVVRFGRDFPFHHVFRDREIDATKAAVAGGFAPELVFAEPGVMVSRFVDGKTYAADDVRANAGKVIDLVRRFHREMPLRIIGSGYIFWVFHVIRDYAHTLKAGNSRMTERLPEFLALSQELEGVQIDQPIIYGHHDLLPANFIDDGEKLWLIDFEYTGFGTPMFDLAGIASNAAFDGDAAEELLARYFGRTPDKAVIRSHSAMQCASLLREAMWSMVSELYLDAPGVDYVAYTQENLDALGLALGAYETRFGKA